MSEEKKFETWEEVITNFLIQRRDQRELDLLKKKDSKKAPNHEKQAIIVQLNNFYEKINPKPRQFEKIKNRKNTGKNKMRNLDFERQRYTDLSNLSSNDTVLNIKQIYEQKLSDINEFHKPINWIAWAADNAASVMFATHVAKLTHPSISKASSFFVSFTPDFNRQYISTSALMNPSTDEAVDNAAITPVSTLLKLEINNKRLVDHITDDDTKPFEWLTNDQDILDEWIEKFSKSFKVKAIRTHALSKQVYFPVPETEVLDPNNPYHLLCNVQSSSMAHKLFCLLSENTKFQKDIYQKDIYKAFPNKAKIAITSSKKAHTNVSPLNVKRDGKLHLLSTQPPIWESQLKPPIYDTSFFYAIPWNMILKENLDYLRDFLLRFEHIELSIISPERMKWIIRWVEQIIDEVFAYCASVQNLPSGWSSTDEVRLKVEHRYLLDPFRNDDEFQAARKSGEWQAVVCNDFANWLNGKLRGRDKQFTPQSEHTRLWKRLMEEQLREFDEPIALEIKHRQREAV